MAQTGKGQRKAGRNKIPCQRYRNEMRQEKNKLRRLRRHLKRHPNDTPAVPVMEALRKMVRT